MMSNKELAAQCLIEAANILGDMETYDESAGRNGIMRRLCEERVKHLDTHTKWHRINSKWHGKKPEEEKFRKQVKDISKKHQQEYEKSRHNNNLKPTASGDMCEHIPTKSSKATDEDIVNALKSMSKPGINERINYNQERYDKRNASKPQNESVYDIFDDIDYSEILEEGARRQGRKIRKESASIDDALFDYYNNLVSKEEGQKIYNKYIKKINETIEKVKDIENDSFIDRLLNTWVRSSELGTDTNKMKSTGEYETGKMYTATEKHELNQIRNDKHYTKRMALQTLTNIKQKIIDAYNKYYK